MRFFICFLHREKSGLGYSFWPLDYCSSSDKGINSNSLFSSLYSFVILLYTPDGWQDHYCNAVLINTHNIQRKLYDKPLSHSADTFKTPNSLLTLTPQYPTMPSAENQIGTPLLPPLAPWVDVEKISLVLLVEDKNNDPCIHNNSKMNDRLPLNSQGPGGMGGQRLCTV